MKKALLALMMLAATARVAAQTPTDTMPDTTSASTEALAQKRNMIKVAPLNWFIPIISYECGFSDKHGLEITLALTPILPSELYTPNNMASLTAAYRYYFSGTTDIRLFLQGGLGLVASWGTYDIFDHNDGWDIYTRPYHYSQFALVPFVGLGVDLGHWKGLNAEFVFNPFTYFKEIEESTPFQNARAFYLASHVFIFKLGYAF